MLKVGQKLYWVPYVRWAPGEQEVIVEKVGRKWATLVGFRHRIDIKTLLADGGEYSCPGSCYLDREGFLSEREAKKAWDLLGEKMRYSSPGGIGAEAIRQAMKLLGFDETKEE